jgi:2-isopropylmalate synthase
LNHIQVSCGDHSIPTATVSLAGPDGEVHQDAGVGSGPVDAVYKAINRIVGVSNTLTEFSVNAVTEGIDAVGEVTIRIQPHNGQDEQAFNPQTGKPFFRTFSGHGASTDIIVASARAYLSALNKMLSAKEEQASIIERQATVEA